MLISLKKQSQSLCLELEKIKQLHSLELSNHHFWLGYLSAYARNPPDSKLWEHLMHLLHNIENVCHQGLFSQNNLMELVIAASTPQNPADKWLNAPGIELKAMIKFLQDNLNEMSIQNESIHNKYFKEIANEQIMVPDSIKKGNSDLGLQCDICCSPIQLNSVCPISCGHLLHRQCFCQYLETQIQHKKFPIICPLEDCEKEIATNDIQEYGEKKVVDKYFQFRLHQLVDKNKQNLSWCPTAGCEAIFQYDQELEQYRCPSCKKQYCIKCRTESHKDKTCEQNKALQNLPPQEKEFLQFIKGAKYKQCPSCKFWVSKNRGCDHMTCRCGYQFCYRCGAKYGECSCEQNESFYDSNGSQDQNEEYPDNDSDY